MSRSLNRSSCVRISPNRSLLPLPTWVIGVRLNGMDAETLAARLRAGEVPVIGRVKEGRFLLDGRTIRDDEIRLIAAGMEQVYR